MANSFFQPVDLNTYQTFFDWNYVTYWGDGIPLLFWVFAYPYDADFFENGPVPYANEYRWQIANATTNKRTRFDPTNTLAGTANTFLQFPCNTQYSSNVLYNLTKGSNNLGPYNSNDAVIIIDSPWARSCMGRAPAPDSKKNLNYAVGVSYDMGSRIASTYNTWEKWWDPICSECGCFGRETKSLLPKYLKDALMQVRGNDGDVKGLGGINNVDVLMFDPAYIAQYGLNEEQAGLVMSEFNSTSTLTATQCSIDKFSWPVHSYGKAFVGAFVAIYKDYTEVTNTVIKNLLIDVPWSGALTGVTTYKSNQILPSQQCTLSCPAEIYFDNTASFALCNLAVVFNNYSWGSIYPAPHTIPRGGCKGGGSFVRNGRSDPCAKTIPTGNHFFFNDLFKLNSAGGFKVAAGDGMPESYWNYPSYWIGNGPSPATYTNFAVTNQTQVPLILPYIGPWNIQYTLTYSRTRVAGGGCDEASFQPWDL